VLGNEIGAKIILSRVQPIAAAFACAVKRVISMASLFRPLTVQLVVPRCGAPQSDTASEIGSHLRSLQLIPIIRTFCSCTVGIVVLDAQKD